MTMLGWAFVAAMAVLVLVMWIRQSLRRKFLSEVHRRVSAYASVMEDGSITNIELGSMAKSFRELADAIQKHVPKVAIDPKFAPIKSIGLWRMHGIVGGKYLVTRRDGTIPEWPNFVLGAKDPAAPAAIRAYANAAEKLKFDAQFVSDMRTLATDFETYRKTHGSSDPDAAPHRKDNPATVELMTQGRNSTSRNLQSDEEP
jgi:HAMP domain-containing protein